MAYKTIVSQKHTTTIYTTKHMRLDLLDRARILAVARHETLEATINRILELGVPILERATWGDGWKRAGGTK